MDDFRDPGEISSKRESGVLRDWAQRDRREVINLKASSDCDRMSPFGSADTPERLNGAGAENATEITDVRQSTNSPL